MENLYMEIEVRKIFIFGKKQQQERDRRWISGTLVILSSSLFIDSVYVSSPCKTQSSCSLMINTHVVHLLWVGCHWFRCPFHSWICQSCSGKKESKTHHMMYPNTAAQGRNRPCPFIYHDQSKSQAQPRCQWSSQCSCSTGVWLY